MLTLQQSHEVRISIIEYLRATFTFKERAVGKALMDFITHEEDGLFRGPFLSAKLPFVRAGEGEEIPLDIKPPFPPFDHQLKSFFRLTTQGGHVPEPTILTTGTGSGKTESFLYPLLDYCYQRKGQDGIKAIILYPMNALATDQAGRLAEAIHNDPLLKGKIRAGLFIGSGGQKNDLPKMMGETHLVEDLDTILDAPPDILLTNFKMLDYALMRSKYHRLWRLNLGNPSLLKFLVLDELHTYDGAQGTDVANLIRRLKLKLALPKGQLCPIGTSATIGTGEDARKLLADYATKIFGETITTDAMVRELRETTEVFFNKTAEELDSFLPSAAVLQDSELTDNETYESYLLRQRLVWNIDEAVDEVVLGSKLRELRIVWDVLEICQRGHTTEAQLVLELNRINPDFRQLPERSGGGDFNPKMGVIRSLFALLAAGKVSNDSGRRFPLLYLQVQLWIRELSGLQRVVATEPKFQWRNQIGQTMLAENALPPWFCRDCGASGWLMVKYDNRNHFENDILEVYDKFFSNHKNLYFVNTDTEDHRAIEGYEATTSHAESVHPISLELSSKKLDNYIPVIAYRQANGNYSRHICPECNSRNSISIIGTRTATLASITTSQVISSDLDIQLEQDRKLLAFTNGVQDAAHQAGFIEARNYRFTFRSALQRVVQSQKEPIRLSDLQQQFIDYWKEKADDSGKGDLAAYLYKFFPSDKVGKVNMESYRFKNGKFKETFIKEFDLRTGWDIVSEYGYNALVGRTLAKTKTSSAFVDNERVKLVFSAFQGWLEENNLAMIEQAGFELFLNGLLHRLRVRGGIGHAYLQKFRTGSLRHWDLNWNRDKRHFLNKGFGPNTRLPKMLTANYSRDFVDSTYTDKENWFHAYFRKSFPLASDHQPIVNEFFKNLLPLLAQEEIGLLDKKESDQVDNYCLKPAAVLVENGVETLECDSCGHLIRSTKSGFEQLQNASCLSYRCVGHYQYQVEETGESYYQKVYNRQRTPRIYAADHTGLLPRKEREQKEIDFKERPRFNSLNALVATSTLEMGIDIGDLNTAMNTSVPPLPANFLQRVGRAGRKSGSALLINFAGNDKHDQFYFEEPLEMMAGQVHPPGCFLEAKEILKRHFFAFCVDSWTTDDPEKHLIPSMLIHIKPINVDLQASSFFANQLILFIQNQEMALFEKFKSAYGSEVADTTFNELKKVLYTKYFYKNIEQAFQGLVQEYRDIREKRFAILKDIKDRKLGKQDDERLELVQELKNLRGTLKMLGRRQFLEHLTNVGLLPNYAFPETGVTLNGRVVKQKGDGALQTPTPVDIEIVRPARQAIKELIPDNYFYTQGYKLLITGLNVNSWEEESKIMRYCSNCDYVDDQEVTTVMCPKCGDPSFGSTSNKHRFLQLKAVKSFNKEENAALDDGSDERLSEIALRTHHFRFDKSIVQGAYAIRSVPFGIEYVTELEVFEVNSGLRKEVMNRSRKTTINGKEVPVEGYITCRYCGCSSAQMHKQEGNRRVPKVAQDYHYPYCKHKAIVFEPQSSGVFEEVFLYRTMMTEALKILLPVQEFETQSSVAMFMSGIDLG